MQFDLVTVGGGFAGLVTACRAGQLGLKAGVLEARTDERYQCSSRYSSGAFGVMQVSLMNTPDVLYDAFIQGTGGTAKPALARVVADNSRRAYEWLQQEGARFVTRGPLTQTQHFLAPPRRFNQEGLDWEGRGADVLMLDRFTPSTSLVNTGLS